MVLFFLVVGIQPALAQIYEFQVNLNEQTYLDLLPVSPFVTVLPDKGNFATYFIGDPISLVYEALKTGYVSILDYTEDERVRILKNNEPVSPGTKKVFKVLLLNQKEWKDSSFFFPRGSYPIVSWFKP